MGFKYSLMLIIIQNFVISSDQTAAVYLSLNPDESIVVMCLTSHSDSHDKMAKTKGLTMFAANACIICDIICKLFKIIRTSTLQKR